LTDRWESQRAARTANGDATAGPQFGWYAPVGESAPAPVSDQSKNRNDSTTERSAQAPQSKRDEHSSNGVVRITDELSSSTDESGRAPVHPALSAQRIEYAPAFEQHHLQEAMQDGQRPSGSVLPSRARAGRDSIWRRLPYLFMVGISMALVLGSGSWSQDQDRPAFMPAGIDNIDLVTQLIGEGALFQLNERERHSDRTASRLIASTSESFPGSAMPTRDQVVSYTVGEGDQLWKIADRFGVRPQTILWSNELSSSEQISPGQQLVILPFDGVIVEVTAEDSIDSLAEEYGVTPSAIRDWPANELGETDSLISDQSIMIPGGVPPAAPESARGNAEPHDTVETDDVEMPEADEEPEKFLSFYNQPPREVPSQNEESSEVSAEGTGEFIWPTTGVITQHFHATHNGWDIASEPGTEIFAVDNGRVTFAGWHEYGLGYAVAIDHGNGYETWYGHMNEHPPVEVGQIVEQGEYIGPMGSTGFSTGPHVHFVIAYNGAHQDPGNYLQ
jgi:murein DD-endopeptidase MepM/ murein hydrolase activator NlpD